MEIYLIRHGMTEGNEKGQYIGRTDQPLCVQGRAKLQQDVAKGRYPAVQRLCISPMLRCRQTAELLYPGMPRLEEVGLREMDFGAWEGFTYEQLKGEAGYLAWLEGGPCPQGEQREDFLRRCQEAFVQCADQELAHGTRSWGIIAHGGTLMAVLSAFDIRQEDFYSYHIDNGGGFRCRLEPELWRTQRRLFVEDKL